MLQKGLGKCSESASHWTLSTAITFSWQCIPTSATARLAWKRSSSNHRSLSDDIHDLLLIIYIHTWNNIIKSHSHRWFSQYGSHETWTCPLPRSGQRPIPLNSSLDEFCLWSWSRHLRLSNMWSSCNPLTGIHSWNTWALSWLSDRGGEQFVVNYKALAGI